MARKTNVLHKTIRHGSSLFQAGNDDHADALVKVLRPRDAKRLLTMGAVAGPGFRDLAAKYVEEPKEKKKAPVEKTPPVDGDEETDGPLPTGFPGRSALLSAGLDSLAKVREASDEDLLGIPGVADATLAAIREALS